MEIDDIVYILCLLFCIGIGKFFRDLPQDKQKTFGSSIGLLILFIVSGFHILHTIVSFTICAIAITNLHPRNVHLISFGIMFGYLVFFRTVDRFNLPAVPGHTNMIQMILTLKLAGVAFEKNSSYLKIQSKEKNKDEDVEITAYDKEIQFITITELFHYTFNYIGVLTGPYYRYRTFRDYFNTPFSKHSKPFDNTVNKLKAAGLYAVSYLICNYLWPINYALETEFYEERSALYRLLYVWPSFFIFRMRIYTGLTLSEAVCTNAGFGAYPDESEVANGEGPKKPYLELESKAETHSYNFKTIENVDVINTEKCWTFREAMKHWNICVQYWLAVNVYRRFPNKKYRTAVTLLVSAFWHGFMPGHYFCIMGAPFYVPVEDMLNKTIRKNAVGIKRKIIDVVFWINKFFAFSYLAMAFLLLSFEKIWKYYGSVYHFGYIWYLCLLFLGLFLVKTTKKSSSHSK